METLYTFLTVICFGSLTWANFFFFKSESNKADITKIIYSFSVLTVFGICFYKLLNQEFSPNLGFLIALLGLFLFWYGIYSVGKCRLNYANSKDDKNDKFVTEGAFKLVRHPFYSSYLMFWIAFSIMFQSIEILCISICFYLIYRKWSKNEESYFLNNQKFGAKYSEYLNDTPRFLPAFWRIFESKVLSKTFR